MRSSIAISALAVFAACTSSPQPATRETSTAVQSRAGYGAGSGQLSPGVFATWFEERRDDTVELLLLVLWRGTPGWHDGPHQVVGSRLPPRPGERSPGYPDTVPYRLVENSRIGTVDLGVRLDPDSRTVQLIGQEVALGDRNVILVDRIDGEGSPRIVDVLRIRPRLPLVRRRDPAGMQSACSATSWSAGGSSEPATPVECEDRPAPPTVDIRAVVRLSPELRAFVR